MLLLLVTLKEENHHENVNATRQHTLLHMVSAPVCVSGVCCSVFGLTGDPDVGLAALGGSCRAPGHTLTPEILQTEDLLHLLTGDLDTGLPHHQTCTHTHTHTQKS